MLAIWALVGTGAARADHQVTDLVSSGPAGGNPAIDVGDIWISPDGSRSFFRTTERLVPADTDDQLDVYRRADGSTTLVSTGPTGGNGPFPVSSVFSRAISRDGTRVAFTTRERLTADDTDDHVDLYERADGVTALVSFGPVGANGAFDVDKAWKVCDSVRAVALDPKVIAITEALFGRKAWPFNTLNFPIGTQQPAHFDTMAFQSDPPNYMCGVWVALEDMDMDNGPLIYYPGSHKLRPTWEEIEELTGTRVNRADHETLESFRAARHDQYAAYCKLVVEHHGLEPEYGLIKKGQALLWAPNLLHGGSPQNDMSRTRHSQVTHYMFEGCRHYTPLIAEPDHIYWLYPTWISDPPPVDTTESIHAAITEHVPEGETVLIASEGYEGLLDLEGHEARHFPQAEDGSQIRCAALSDDAIDHLERMRADGAHYVVWPRKVLNWLAWSRTDLQRHLEDQYQGLLRDGNICAIYDLR